MFTASFRFSGLDLTDRRLVSVALWPPRGYSGRRALWLAPPEVLLRWWQRSGKTAEDWTYYCQVYAREVLAQLDPGEVYRELGEGAVLCCFERPGERCHRREVAQWLQTALGIQVPEWSVLPKSRKGRAAKGVRGVQTR